MPKPKKVFYKVKHEEFDAAVHVHYAISDPPGFGWERQFSPTSVAEARVVCAKNYLAYVKWAEDAVAKLPFRTPAVRTTKWSSEDWYKHYGLPSFKEFAFKVAVGQIKI